MGQKTNKKSKIYITFLEENTRNYLYNQGEGKYLRGQRNNYKRKNDKLNFIKVKNLCSLKDTIKTN